MNLTELARFETAATDATRLLKAMAHDARLLVLCQLVDGELQAGQFATRLSQSALSQHLAVLRDKQLVSTRREAQTVYYSVHDGLVHDIIASLHGAFCAPGPTR